MPTRLTTGLGLALSRRLRAAVRAAEAAVAGEEGWAGTGRYRAEAQALAARATTPGGGTTTAPPTRTDGVAAAEDDEDDGASTDVDDEG